MLKLYFRERVQELYQHTPPTEVNGTQLYQIATGCQDYQTNVTDQIGAQCNQIEFGCHNIQASVPDHIEAQYNVITTGCKDIEANLTNQGTVIAAGCRTSPTLLNSIQKKRLLNNFIKF